MGDRHGLEVTFSVVVIEQLNDILTVVCREIEQHALATEGRGFRRPAWEDPALSASILLIRIMRHTLRSAANFIMRSVDNSMPVCALMTTSANGGQRANGLPCKVRVSGGVDEVNLGVQPVEADHR